MNTFFKIFSSFNKEKNISLKLGQLFQFLKEINTLKISNGDKCFLLQHMLEKTINHLEGKNLTKEALKILSFGGQDITSYHFEKLFKLVYSNDPNAEEVILLWSVYEKYPAVEEELRLTDMPYLLDSLISKKIKSTEDLINIFIVTSSFDYQRIFWKKISKNILERHHFEMLTRNTKIRPKIHPELCVAIIKKLNNSSFDKLFVSKISIGLAINCHYVNRSLAIIVIQSIEYIADFSSEKDDHILILKLCSSREFINSLNFRNNSLNFRNSAANFLFTEKLSVEELMDLNSFGIFEDIKEFEFVLKTDYDIEYEKIMLEFSDEDIENSPEIDQSIEKNLKYMKRDPISKMYLKYKTETKLKKIIRFKSDSEIITEVINKENFNRN